METIKINDNKFTLSDDKVLGRGQEATVYQLSKDKCVKKYFEDQLKDNLKKEKIIALCRKYEEFSNTPQFQNVAFPEELAYLLEKNRYELCGFSMKAVPNCEPLIAFKYNHFDQKFGFEEFDDKQCVKLVYSLFEMIAYFHSENIIIGDISPDNILINTKNLAPYFIDFDSVKYGNYECSTLGKAEYVCPDILDQFSSSNGGYIFSKESDIFALTSICFELLVGAKPFSTSVSPPTRYEELKRMRVSSLAFFYENKMIKGFTLFSQQQFQNTKIRLKEIENNYPEIFEQFTHVFLKDGRSNLLCSSKKVKKNDQPETIKTEKTKIKPIRGYLRSKQRTDPAEFISFINRFNLQLP